MGDWLEHSKSCPSAQRPFTMLIMLTMTMSSASCACSLVLVSRSWTYKVCLSGQKIMRSTMVVVLTMAADDIACQRG